MPRERDAVNVQPGAAGHFHVDDRERDGNAEAALEDDVQQAVAEVVVVGAVAAEAFAREEQAIERGTRARTGAGPSASSVVARPDRPAA